MIHPLFIIVGLAIGIFVIFRVITHFFFCRKVSRKNPGEKLHGCPIWTHENNEGNAEKPASTKEEK